MGEKGHRFGTETLRTGAEELTHEAQVLTHGVMTAPFRLRTYRLIRKILIGFILVSVSYTHLDVYKRQLSACRWGRR